MQDLLANIWRFEYALIPCLAAYAVFDFPILIRRLTRRVYVPVYFAFFPFGYSDELYARYFDEDHLYEVGGPIERSQVESFRAKIIWTSILSLALTMAVSPFLAALFSHYALSALQQTQFFYTLAVIKAALLLKSLYDLKFNFRISSTVSIAYVAVIYAVYWAALLIFFDRGLTWISERDAEGGISAIGNGLLDFLLYDVGVQIVFVSLMGALLPWRLTRGTAQPIKRPGESDG